MTATVSMDDLTALCKRRGFIFPASEIYQGINGFWDYGPLGVELKNNVRDAWWNDMVRCPPLGPDGQPLEHRRRRHRNHPEPEGVGSLAVTSLASTIRWSTAARPRRAIATTTCACSATRPKPSTRCSRSSRANAEAARKKLAQGQGNRAGRFRRAAAVGRARRARPRDRPRREHGRHADRAAPVQPDVQDLRRRGPDRRLAGVPAARDRAGHLPQLQERARHHAREGAVRHRADRQGIPQRGHAAQLHLPLARVRADGDGVVLPARRRPSSGTSSGATSAAAGGRASA